MEPVSLILTALIAGIKAAAPSVGAAALSDAYLGLKTLIQNKFANNEKAKQAYEDFENDPDTYEKPISKHLQMAGADQDDDIIKAAQKLMSLIEPEQFAKGKFNIQAGGDVFGIAQDTKGDVTQTFLFGDIPSNSDAHKK